MFTWQAGRNPNLVLECFADGERIGRIVRTSDHWQVMLRTSHGKLDRELDQVIGMTGGRESAKLFLEQHRDATNPK